mgnify:FL=1
MYTVFLNQANQLVYTIDYTILLQFTKIVKRQQVVLNTQKHRKHQYLIKSFEINN